MAILTNIILAPIVLSPIIATLINNIIKTIIHSIKNNKFKISPLYKSCGGMPSSHSAFLGALLASIFIQEGISNLFLVVFALSILLISNLLAEKSKTKIHEIIIGLIIGAITGLLLAFYLY